MVKAVILVEPEIPENTGFISRLATNYSTDLRIVNPGFNLVEARKTAKNSQDKLRETKIFDTVEEALDDLKYVIGTKPGKGLPVEKQETRSNTSLMIGRESSGLTNEELRFCDTVVHIDVPGYSSLNQSHATAVLLNQLKENESKRRLMSTGQKKKIKELTQGVVEKMILRSSPSEQEADRLIAELKSM